MKPHDTFLELAAIAIDFPLTSADRGRLEQHLADCAACGRTAHELRGDALALAHLPPVTLPERRGAEILAAALHPPVVRNPVRLRGRRGAAGAAAPGLPRGGLRAAAAHGRRRPGHRAPGAEPGRLARGEPCAERLHRPVGHARRHGHGPRRDPVDRDHDQPARRDDVDAACRGSGSCLASRRPTPVHVSLSRLGDPSLLRHGLRRWQIPTCLPSRSTRFLRPMEGRSPSIAG